MNRLMNCLMNRFQTRNEPSGKNLGVDMLSRAYVRSRTSTNGSSVHKVADLSSNLGMKRFMQTVHPGNNGSPDWKRAKYGLSLGWSSNGVSQVCQEVSKIQGVSGLPVGDSFWGWRCEWRTRALPRRTMRYLKEGKAIWNRWRAERLLETYLRELWNWFGDSVRLISARLWDGGGVASSLAHTSLARTKLS